MKFLILHLAHWDQLLGGAELQLMYLSEYLLSIGHEVHFVYPNRNENKVSTNGVVLHPLRYTKIPGTFGKTWFRYKNKLERKIGEIKPDVLITRTNSSWAGIVASIADKDKIKHIHFVASDRDVNINSIKNSLSKPFDEIEKKWIKRLFVSKSNFVVQNKYQLEQLALQFKIRSNLLSQVAPINDASHIKKENIPIRIIWIANFKTIKRPEKFLEIAEFFKDHKNVLFEMVGGFSDTKYAKMLDKVKTNQNFVYHGKCNNDKVNSLLNKAHILVNTSDAEGFSNTFIQAWLRKVVVISINTDPDNILTITEIGYCTNNVSNTIQQLTDLLGKPEHLQRISEKAREYAVNNHIMNEMYYQKLGFY